MVVVSIISIVIYIIAIIIVYTNIYEFKKDGKLKFIIIGIIVVFLMTWFIVLIGSNGIQAENDNFIKVAKKTSVLLFAPINTILTLPYLGNLLNKYKQKRLTDEKLKKKLIIFAIIFFIIVIIEKNYIKNFEIGLLNSIK
jgi:hypothetical protein